MSQTVCIIMQKTILFDGVHSINYVDFIMVILLYTQSEYEHMSN